MSSPRLLPGCLALAALLVFTVTATLAQDYTVTTTATAITVTDVSGSGDTLAVAQPAAGQIRFAAAGRTFSVNGGAPIAGSSGNLSLTGVTSLTVDAGAGSDTINVGAFAGATFPSLTLLGGAGDDTVNFSGDITFAPGHGLTVAPPSFASADVETVNVTAGANVIATGSGVIQVKCGRNVSLTGGASLETENANLSVVANRGVPNGGNFIGLSLSGAGTMLRCAGDNLLYVEAQGGDDGGGNQSGVRVSDGARILAAPGVNAISIRGIGGGSAGSGNRGVVVTGAGSAISGPGRLVEIRAEGNQVGSGAGGGLAVLDGGEISGAFVNAFGFGRGAAGTGSNHGVEIAGSGSRIAASGSVSLIGSGAGVPSGAGGSWGLVMADAGSIATPAINLAVASAALDATASIVSGSVRFDGFSAADLGGPDSATALGLTDAELDRFTATHFEFIGSADITISAPISRVAATTFILRGELNDEEVEIPGRLRAPGSGTDLDLGTGTLTLNKTLVVPITGAAPDTGYPQLRVIGGVNLEPADMDPVRARLEITGTTFAGTVGETFTIVENDGTDPIVGTFAGLPEGATLAWPGPPGVVARISYVGGTGNDVVLTLESARFIVTNTNDAGLGSLRAAVAASASGGIITFDPALGSAPTIVFASEIVVAAPGTVIIDASSVPGGVILDGGPGANRHLTVHAGTTLHLTGLAFTGGGGAGSLTDGQGGAILSHGTLTATACSFVGNSAAANRSGGAISGTPLTLTRCLFSGNSAGSGGAVTAGSPLSVTDCVFTGNTAVGGGAISSSSTGARSITRCTFSGNSASTGGALVVTQGTITLLQCTLSGNTATSRGGALYGSVGGSILNSVSVTLRHCTVAGNSASAGAGVVDMYGGSLRVENSIVAGNTSTTGSHDFAWDGQRAAFVSRGGRNVIGTNTNVTATFPAGAPNEHGNYVGTDASPMDPLLAPLGDYGGRTPTRALLPGSPARDLSSASTVTSDQRDFPLVGVADVGAYEAGTFANFAAFIWETLPATATAAQHAAAFDFDGDGATNLHEWLALTDAGDAASHLRIVALTRAEPDVTVTFPSVVGRSYTFEFSPDLATWTRIAGAPVAGTGSPLAIQLGSFPGVPKLFVRVRTGP